MKCCFTNRPPSATKIKTFGTEFAVVVVSTCLILKCLLFYGADLGAKKASGNTALHSCPLQPEQLCHSFDCSGAENRELKNVNNSISEPSQDAIPGPLILQYVAAFPAFSSF